MLSVGAGLGTHGLGRIAVSLVHSPVPQRGTTCALELSKKLGLDTHALSQLLI